MATRTTRPARTVTVPPAPPAPPADEAVTPVTPDATVTPDAGTPDAGTPDGATANGEPTNGTEDGKGPEDPNNVVSVGVDVSRCPVKNEAGTRQCILAEDHKTYAVGDNKGDAFTETIDGHLFRASGKKREFAPFKGTLTFEDVPEDEFVEGAKDGIRDEIQKQIDEKVKAAHTSWVELGKPDVPFNDLGTARKRILFEPGNEGIVKQMLESAGRYLKLRVTIVGPKSHKDGAKMYYYAARDKIAKTTTPAAAANGAETPAANGDGKPADEAAKDTADVES
jgi:hypothetical protein